VNGERESRELLPNGIGKRPRATVTIGSINGEGGYVVLRLRRRELALNAEQASHLANLLIDAAEQVP
jgi:hypothetical protein